MGTLSPQDERNLLLGCGLMVGSAVLFLLLVGAGAYHLIQWIFA